MSSRILNIIAEKSLSFDNIFFLNLVNFSHSLLLLTSFKYLRMNVCVRYSGKCRCTCICQVSRGIRTARDRWVFSWGRKNWLEGHIQTLNFGTMKRTWKSLDIHSCTHSFIHLTGPNISTKYCAKYKGSKSEQEYIVGFFVACFLFPRTLADV